MTVAKAITAFAVDKRKIYLRQIIESAGYISPFQFFLKVYPGSSAGSGYNILNGVHDFTEESAKRWAKALKISPDGLLNAPSIKTAGTSAMPPKPKPSPIIGAPTVSIPRQKQTDIFSFTIDKDGSASIMLAVSGLPVDRALELIASLKLSDLCGEPLRITHQKPPDTQE